MGGSIAIVGGGFSGAALAYHLAVAALGPLSIDIVEPRGMLGAGVAYGDARDAECLNVPAIRMILDRGDPTGFARWLHAHGEGNESSYAPRRRFATFTAAQVSKAFVNSFARLRHHRTEAVGIAVEAGKVVMRLRDGAVIRSDVAVLCTGHERPKLPATLEHLAGHPAVIADPWKTDALDSIDLDSRVLLVGTGLTAADVVVGLRHRGHRGRIVATSRRGLIPRRSGLYPEPRGSFVQPSRAGVAALLRAVRCEVREAGAEGVPWQAILWQLREQNGAIWRGWSEEQQSRFLRHLRPFWDVHRFQMAPAVADVVDDAISAGQMHVKAGRIANGRAQGDGIAVEIVRRRSAPRRIERQVFDTIVNCSGGGTIARDGFVGRLLADGWAQCDRHALGLRVRNDGRLDNRFGSQPSLFALGSLTRGRLGEVSGASEIADLASRLAALLLREISDMRTPAVEPLPGSDPSVG